MNQVTVQLHSVQQVDDQKETMGFKLPGRYEYTPNQTVLEYTQHTEEEGDVTTCLTVTKQEGQAVVQIARQGQTANTLTVERGVPHTTSYTMGPCTFEMEVKATVVDCHLNSKGGSIKLCYDLTINGTPASKNTMKIRITE